MFSFSKLLVLAAIILAVWYGFKMLTRIQKERARAEVDRARKPQRLTAEDMVQCKACGVYVPAVGAVKCGRPGCPQG